MATWAQSLVARMLLKISDQKIGRTCELVEANNDCKMAVHFFDQNKLGMQLMSFQLLNPVCFKRDNTLICKFATTKRLTCNNQKIDSQQPKA